MKLSPHEMAWCLQQAGFAGNDVITGIAVGLAESKGDTDALGVTSSGASIGNRDHGVWQISGRWHGDKLQSHPDWRDPLVNARLARLIFDEAVRAGKVGWTPWSTFNKPTSGAPASYEEHLLAATIAAKFPIKPAYPPWQLAMFTSMFNLPFERIADIQQIVDELPVLEEIMAAFKTLRVTKTDEVSFQ